MNLTWTQANQNATDAYNADMRHQQGLCVVEGCQRKPVNRGNYLGRECKTCSQERQAEGGKPR